MSPWSLVFSRCTVRFAFSRFLLVGFWGTYCCSPSCWCWYLCQFAACILVSYQVPHKSSMGHLFRCGSSVLLLSVLTQVLYGSLVSVWIIYSSLISQASHKSSMGRLFRCGSSVLLLSGPTQVLYGSLVSMWITYSSLIRSHTSPLWVACFGVDPLFFSYQVSHKSSMGHLFSSPCVRVRVCVCMHVYRKFCAGESLPLPLYSNGRLK
jgi:hypothetical protein